MGTGWASDLFIVSFRFREVDFGVVLCFVSVSRSRHLAHFGFVSFREVSIGLVFCFVSYRVAFRHSGNILYTIATHQSLNEKRLLN